MNFKLIISFANFFTIFALIAWLSSNSVSANSELPDMGSSAARTMSLKEEQDLGDKIMMQVRRSMPLVTDPELVDYIQHLGFRLVSQNKDAINRQFHFFIVNQPSVNAFALPGGYIGFHTGLIMESENEHELAGVMAHEIAHVTQRHLARRAELSQQMSLPALASIIGSILLAVHNSQAGLAALAATQAGQLQTIINHTRSNESEADRIGIAMLEKAGFDPSGMVSFFEKMQKVSRYYRKPPEFLSTHPLSRSRIADARARVSEKKTPYIATSLSYQLVKAKLRSILNKNKHQLQKDLVEAKKRLSLSKTDYNYYGYALALIENDRVEEAEAIISRLYKKSPSNISYIIAKSKINNLMGNYDNSIMLLGKGLETYPNNHSLTIALAETHMANKKPQNARKVLMNHAYEYNESHSLYRLLAKAQRNAGFVSEAHESQGQYLYLVGDIHAAKAEFLRALRRKTKDPYLDARISARIDAIDQLIYESRRRR